MRAGSVRISRFTAFAGLAALICTSPALADVKDGVDAWSRGDFTTAIKEWRDPAAKGDADAQFNLAQAYKLGRGVPHDLKRAEQLFTRAATQGHLEASDNLGLLLFQRGERERALPFIKAASGRGDPRAHYILGLAHFNGDGIAKDWERAYALMSLAQQAHLPQATSALAQMDQHISLEQRQRSVTLASTINAEADATRLRQVAASDLAVTGGRRSETGNGSLKPFTPGKPNASQVAAGADYTRGGVPPLATIINTDSPAPKAPAKQPTATAKSAVQPVPVRPVKAPAAKIAESVTPPKPVPSVKRSGPWKVQLGAFGVQSNADRLWDRVKSRPEISGRTKLMIPTGRVTRLLVGGYADQASAQSACKKLKAADFACMVTRD